ncbi:MAG: TOBE domain-containing protein, partial [Bacillota bacterium]
EEVYSQPASATVAQLTGSPPMNLIPSLIEDGFARADGFSIPVTGASGRVLLGIRPEEITLGGRLPGRVEVVQPLGRKIIVELAIGQYSRLKMAVPSGPQIRRGDAVGVGFSPESVRVFNADTGELVPAAPQGPPVPV